MNKFSALLLGATLVAGASFAASATPGAQQSASPTFYYWLHPKLGMVKVDKATNAMVKTRRAGPEVVEQRSQLTSIVAGGSSGYVSERGEATYSGPTPRNTVQQTSDTNPRAMGISSEASRSRGQVLQELKEFQRNPVTADGYRLINGEIGYVYVGPKSAP